MDGCFLRAYKELQFAKDFAERGEVQLRPIQYYREIDDQSRRDDEEGEAALQIPSDVQSLVINSNTLEVIDKRVQLSHAEQASLDRHAIREALCDLNLLSIRRR